MDSRWPQIEELYHAAREQPPDRRAAFLDRECAGDSALRNEVESLLPRDGQAAGPLDRAAWDGMGGLLNNAAEGPLAVGTILGPYRITGALGAGGMGQVYRAHDSRLGRSIAIKILRAQYNGRFQREAQAIAVLNHPNICTLHDVGANYLVMELVDGSTLAERIAQGRLPFDEALAIARQIGAALGTWLISNGEGAYPAWSRKERQLFYQARDGRIMVVDYTATGDSFAASPPRVRLDRALPIGSNALAPDGKRFAITVPALGPDQKPPTHAVFLVNFLDELRRRIPPN